MSDQGKAQWVRIADVIFIGPLMAYGGLELRREAPILGTMLAALGVATVLYNGRNYLRIASQRVTQ